MDGAVRVDTAIGGGAVGRTRARQVASGLRDLLLATGKSVAIGLAFQLVFTCSWAWLVPFWVATFLEALVWDVVNPVYGRPVRRRATLGARVGVALLQSLPTTLLAAATVPLLHGTWLTTMAVASLVLGCAVMSRLNPRHVATTIA